MRSPTSESEWWIDHAYWPGPEEPPDYDYSVWYEYYPGPGRSMDMSELVRWAQKHIAGISHDGPVYAGLTSTGVAIDEFGMSAREAGEKIAELGKVLGPVVEALEPPKPSKVGPRPQRTFDRKGKRRF